MYQKTFESKFKPNDLVLYRDKPYKYKIGTIEFCWSGKDDENDPEDEEFIYIRYVLTDTIYGQVGFNAHENDLKPYEPKFDEINESIRIINELQDKQNRTEEDYTHLFERYNTIYDDPEIRIVFGVS